MSDQSPVMTIRQARPEDSVRLLEIYAPIVEGSSISFEYAVPTEKEFADRISKSLQEHDWLVMESKDAICGYAYGTPHRARQAYQRSVETSVYVSSKFRGRGVGTELYKALFESLSQKGYHNAFAGITMPNDASVSLHRSLGFESIGTFREVGFKFGNWHDVSWWQRAVAE